MTYTSVDGDEQDGTDDQGDEAQDGDNSDQSQDTDYSDQAQDGDASTGAQALTEAAPHEVEAHRNMLGDALQSLSDKGIDVDALAEKAGVSSSDVDALNHDDLANLTQYVAQNHPEILQQVTDRYPAAQGLLGMVLGGNQGGSSGGSGGFLGGILGRFTGGG